MIRYIDYDNATIQKSRPTARTALSLRAGSTEEQLEAMRLGLEDLSRDRPTKAIDFYNITVSGTQNVELRHNFGTAVRFWLTDCKPEAGGSIGVQPVVQRLTSGATPWTDQSTENVLSLKIVFTGKVSIRVEAAQ